MNFRQIIKEEQQLISVRPISSTFQQTSGIRNVANENVTEQSRRRCKEVREIIRVIRVRIRIWVTDKAFNGLSTLVDDQRGRIEVPGAIRV